jgi:ATP/ADP translocase
VICIAWIASVVGLSRKFTALVESKKQEDKQEATLAKSTA